MSPGRNIGAQREAILEAATQLFSETGYAGTTVRDIAAQVGVLPGSLYAHIDGKERMLMEIVEAGIDQFLEAGDAASQHHDPADRLRSLIKAHVSVVGENPERTLVVFHQWRYLEGPNQARIIDKRRRYEGLFTTVVEDGIKAGMFSPQLDARIAVLSILGSLNWTAEWFRPDGPAGAGEVGDRLADVIAWGLLRT
jgi:TetR/AcrR family transcriptional regulator, cholesterol catabolism regulator